MRFEKEVDAFEHEKFLISCFRDLGFQLVNLTDGGEGSSGFRLTDETKIKIGAASRTRNPSTYKKISEKLKGKKFGEETKLKMSLAKLGKKKSDEHRRNISRAAKGRLFSETTRARLSEAAKKRQQKRRDDNEAQSKV
jgi:hypothetical protein